MYLIVPDILSLIDWFFLLCFSFMPYILGTLVIKVNSNQSEFMFVIVKSMYDKIPLTILGNIDFLIIFKNPKSFNASKFDVDSWNYILLKLNWLYNFIDERHFITRYLICYISVLCCLNNQNWKFGMYFVL